MASIPEGTEWFIGYLVTATSVGDNLPSMKVAVTLIKASNPKKRTTSHSGSAS